MHALYVIQRYYPYQGGSELVCQVLAERLAAEGNDVTVWTTDAWDLDHFWAAGRRVVRSLSEHHNGVNIQRFPVKRVPGPPIIYPVLRRAMVELGRLPGTAKLLLQLAQITPQVPEFKRALAMTPQRFDFIHSANITLDFMLIPAWRYARKHGVPHIITPYVHLGVPDDRSLVRYYTMPHHVEIMKTSDRVIVQTPSEEAYLRKLGIPQAIMRCIGVGVEPAELQGGDAERFRQETGIHEPFVLSIGTLARDKGTLDLISAMQQLWQQGRHERLVLIGTPMAHFESAWDVLPSHIRERIHIFPRAAEARKRDALAAASVFAMPSRTDSFGIVYLEAWLYHLPVIGAYAGGVPDVITDGETGFLVPFGDERALAQRLAQLLDDRQLAQRMGAAGHQHTLKHLTWQVKYRQIRNVYAELVE